MQNVERILMLAGSLSVALTTILTFLLGKIKNVKIRKIAETVLKLNNAIVPYIEQAEAFTNYSGAEKKEYVLTKVCMFALKNGINFDETYVSEKIEEIINLTNQVNTNKENN